MLMTSKQTIKATRLSNINIQDIILNAKKNNKYCSLKYKNRPLILQTPYLKVKDAVRKTNHDNLCIIDTLMETYPITNAIKWSKFIDDLESHISNQVSLIGKSWFNQNNIIFKSLIKTNDENIQYIKWPINLAKTIIVDENKNSILPTSIKAGDYLKFIIEFSNIWIDDNKFGLAIVVHKILLKDIIENDYVFDDSDDETENIGCESDIMSLLVTEKNKESPKKGSNNILLSTSKKFSIEDDDDGEF